MRKRIMKTLAMLGLSVCILVGGAVSGVAEEPARKECKENEHKWKTFVEYREDCVPTDFTLEGKTFTLCPHCGKEGRKDPVQRLTKVKNTFSNFSNLEIYEGSLQDGPKIMTVAFYYQTCMNKVVCTKCGKVKSNTVVTDARVMDSDVTANIELPASAVQGYTLQQVHADGSKTPVQVSYSENGQKAFFQLNMAGGAPDEQKRSGIVPERFCSFPGAGLEAGQRKPQHQRDADGKGHGDLERRDAVGQSQSVVALDEVVGGVVDAGTGHQREDAGQQEDGDRRFEHDGEDAGQQRQRDDGQQRGGKAFQPEEDGQLVNEPAHRADKAAVGQGALGGGEENGKAQGARPGDEELGHQLADLLARQQKFCHAATTPVHAA